MSCRYDQNGRQPPMSRQLQNSSDIESQNENLTQTGDIKDICRNFIWGACNKNTLCKFRHDLDFEEMKKVLKFCHDYQNQPGCTRENCTYLHTTKEEESLFFATGQLPRVLAERHANMSATVAETIPQIALFIQESLVGHPPPPPPPPAPVSAPTSPAPLPAVVPVRRQTPNMVPIQQLLPPPPPPTVPSTVATSQLRGPVFTVTVPPSQNSVVYAETQPPLTVLPRFDASRPPPPIPTHAHTKNGSLKRASSTESEGQPCKIMKTDEDKDAVVHCEQCVQREIRVESLRDKITRLQRDEEYEALAFKQMLLEYQNREDLLRSLVNQDLYNLIDEYIEQSVSNLEAHDVLAQFSQSCAMLPGMSAVPKQFLIQLIDYIFGGSSFKSVPSSTFRLDETLTTSRRTNTAPKTDVLQAFLDILKQSNASEQGSANDFASDILKHASHNSNTNGCHQLTNGLKLNPQMRTAPPPTYQYAGAPPSPAPPSAASARMYYPPPYQPPPSVSVPPPSAPLPAGPAYLAGLPRYPPGLYRQQQ